MTNHLLYIDPGTGSLFYQALLSAILTVSVFWHRIKLVILHLFAKFKEKKQNKGL